MPQPHPQARLRPRRSQNKEQRAPLVRQTAVSYDGSIIVACHEDGSITRYDRCQARPESAATARQGEQREQQPGQEERRPGSADGSGSRRGSKASSYSGGSSSSGSESGSSSAGSSSSDSSSSEDEQEM